MVKSRLVQFAAAGGLLYALAARRGDERAVDLDPAALASLEEAQARKLGVPALGEDGKREVGARAIEDEVLYREALRMGLDRDDPVIKQRLVQKLLILVEDLGGASRDPARGELMAYYEKTRARWRRPARYAIVQVFGSRVEALPPADALAGAIEPPPLGDPFPYPRRSTSSREEMARLFGVAFADGVTALSPGSVSEPLRSPFGWHRVRLLERTDGGEARFDEVEKEVLLEYLLERRERVVGAYLKETIAAYDVRVGGRELRGFVPTRRVAARTESSAED